ncbi:MAG TPA: SET domain-containing protein-lysine N-methyltransferase [Candidatus Limnocylindria bacterium]
MSSGARVEVRRTAAKGRGLFALDAIDAGAEIVRCPALVIPGGQWRAIEPTIVGDYCFEWDSGAALALGLGSMCNHDAAPNAEVVADRERTELVFRATRAIPVDEEITIAYRGREDRRGLWFTAGR